MSIDHLAKTPIIENGAYVAPQAFVNGDVVVGEDSSVWPMAVIRGDMHETRIGKRVSVQDGAVIHTTHISEFNAEGHPTIVGDDVTIGHNACLHGCKIGNQVLIGIGAIVLDGAIVEDKVVIAAGTLVPPNKTLESGYMYMGSPAKAVRPLSEKEMSFFQYSSGNYVRLKNRYLEMAD